MKNRFIISGLLALAAINAIAACEQEEIPAEEQGYSVVKHGDTISITAGFETPSGPETKTYVEAGTSISWSRGDNTIFVFDSAKNKNIFTCSNEESDSVSPTRTFTGSITEGSTIEYILWTGKKNSDQSELKQIPGGPTGNESITEGGNGYIEWDYTKSIDYGLKDVFEGVSLPSIQALNNINSFAPDANIAIMKKGDHAFKSVCGYIRFTIPQNASGFSDIDSVTFHANENLAGKLQIDYNGDSPIATIVDENGSKEVTVRAQYKDGHYKAGTLFAVVPAGTYTGFTITVKPISGTPFTLSSSRNVVVVRGQYTDCGTLPTTAPTDSTVLGQVVQVLPKNISVGGIYMDSASNTLYVGYGGKVEAYDVKTPMQPKLIGSGSILGNPRQMMVYNNRLFVTARESGTWIYSLSNLKNKGTIDLIKRYDTVEFATGLDVAGDVLFVGERQNGVEFIDIKNLSNPQHIRMIKTSESQSVFYRDGYLYSGEWSGGCVTVFDVHDMSNIQKLDTLHLKGYGDGLWITGDSLYVSTGHDSRHPSTSGHDGKGHGVEIWDLSQNPVHPTRKARKNFGEFYKQGIDYWLPRPSGDGKTIFCGDVFGGLYVVDMRQKDSLRIIDHYVLNADPNNGKSAVTSLALGYGVVYMATSGNGLLAIQCPLAKPCTRNRGDLPTNSTARYNYETDSESNFVAWKPSGRGAVREAAEWQGFLFVACGDAGLQVAKPSWNPGLTVTTYKPNAYHNSDIPSISFAGSVAIQGDTLYVAQGQEGVGVYLLTMGNGNGSTVTDGPILRRITQIKASLANEDKYKFSYWVTLPNDQYVVSSNRYGGHQFLSKGHTGNTPTYTYKGSVTKDLNYMRYISNEVCADNRLPYATRSGMFWVDLSSPASISGNTDGDMITDIKGSITGGVTHFRNGSALIMNDKNAYLVGSGATSITQTIWLGETGLPRWDGSDALILTNHLDKKIYRINVSNLSSPYVKYTEVTSGNPEPATFVEAQGTKKAIVPCGYQGLLIEK